MLKENLRFKNWYQDSKNAIEQRYGEHTSLFINLLAATSPRKTVVTNFKLANRILIEVLDTGTFNRNGMMKAHADNVQRAIDDEPLSGNKVRRFAENLRGNLTPVTIDVWMLRYLHEERPSLSDKQYIECEKRCQSNARRLGLEPAEYQAIAWVAIRQQYGYKPVSFASIMNMNQKQFSFMEV